MTNELDLIKRLREELGAPLLQCKKSIQECGLDFDKNLDFLRKTGIINASKKSDRSTTEGAIGYIFDANNLLIIELNCETDFVAKNDVFIGLLNFILNFALKNPNLTKDEFLLSTVDSNTTIKDKIAEVIMKTGENITLSHVKCVDIRNKIIGCYIHNQISDKKNAGKIFSYIIAENSIQENTKNEISTFLNSIAMHIVGSSPLFLDKNNIDEVVIAKEREIYTEQLKDSNKPKNIIDKIVDGKIEKFLSENCLLMQKFIMNNDVTVLEAIQKFKKDNNLNFTLVSFNEIALGSNF